MKDFAYMLGSAVVKALECAEHEDYVEVGVADLDAAGIPRVSLEYCDWLAKFKLRQSAQLCGPGRRFVRLRKQR